jgi:heme exporter protein D
VKDALLTWLAMGGYGRFVWSAYGAAIILLVGLLIVSLRALRARERELAASEGERRPRRERS